MSQSFTDTAGTLNYVTGNLSSSGSIVGTGLCTGIRVFANGSDGSFTVNAGQTITVRSGSGIDINADKKLTAPVVAWVSGNLDVLILGLS